MDYFWGKIDLWPEWVQECKMQTPRATVCGHKVRATLLLDLCGLLCILFCKQNVNCVCVYIDVYECVWANARYVIMYWCECGLPTKLAPSFQQLLCGGTQNCARHGRPFQGKYLQFFDKHVVGRVWGVSIGDCSLHWDVDLSAKMWVSNRSRVGRRDGFRDGGGEDDGWRTDETKRARRSLWSIFVLKFFLATRSAANVAPYHRHVKCRNIMVVLDAILSVFAVCRR